MTEEPSLVTPSMTREFLQNQLADEGVDLHGDLLDNQNRVLKHSRLFWYS